MLSADRYHPSAAGYALITAELFGALQQAFTAPLTDPLTDAGSAPVSA